MSETLNTEGFLLTEVACGWDVLSAEFGDGFEAGSLVGDPTGTRTWTIRIDALPDSVDQVPAIPDEFEPPLDPSTRANYLWRFYQASKVTGNQPFWIEVDDPADGGRKLFLASFIDNRLTYTILCAKLYSTGLQLRQRRLADVESPVDAEE